MSKERLKYWEELWGIGYVKFVPDLFEYAKEQAERVAELETDSSAFHTLEILYMESEQQNEKFGELINNLFDKLYEYENQIIRYREALEFYANQSNWMNIEVPTMMDGEPEMVTREPLIFDDGGRKAREALEEPE